MDTTDGLGRVAGKVALVTGGGTGIGAAAAERLAAEGATVVVCGRRPEPPQQVAERIVAAGGRARAVAADVANEARFAALVREVEASEGRLDILVNNAFSYAGGMIADTATADWRAAFATSLDAAFFGLRAALPGMAARGGGSVVNLSSVMALMTIPGASAYSAAKAALLSLTRSAALEGARAGVRVNVVIPGVILTPSTQATLPDEAAVRATAASVPNGRIGDPAEVAAAILFLASDEASYITGASLLVDGGKTCELNVGASQLGGLDGG